MCVRAVLDEEKPVLPGKSHDVIKRHAAAKDVGNDHRFGAWGHGSLQTLGRK